MFFWILIFEPNWPFCKGYRLWMIGDFQNCLISRIFVFFFERCFAQDYSNVFVESISASLLESFSQTNHFAKGIAFALCDTWFSKWSDFCNIWLYFQNGLMFWIYNTVLGVPRLPPSDWVDLYMRLSRPDLLLFLKENAFYIVGALDR